MNAMRRALLDWYRPRRRLYPWRRTRNAYAIWVSEVMLQQTQAARVAPAYRRFLTRFPSVDELAAAPTAEVVRSWSGLGYNRRAVGLSRAARAIVLEHGGRIPSDPATLLGLPGVGPYTAAAVASIAFGRPVAAIDTNVRRIVARAELGVEAHEAHPVLLREIAGSWLDAADPGSWNQAMMDLGREHCRPKPRCSACPLRSGCAFLASGAPIHPPLARQGRFEGSSRQLRGRVVDVLRERSSATLSTIAARSGFEEGRVLDAIRGLHRDGVLSAGPAALAGRSTGRVRLAV